MPRDHSPIGQALGGIALLGAGLLFVSLFLDWFAISDASQEVTVSGWGGLEFADTLFVLIVVATIAALGMGQGPAIEERPGARRPRAALFFGFGGLALLFVVIAAFTTVPTVEILTSFAGGEVESSTKAGLYVAGGGAVLLLIAGAMGAAGEAEGRRAGSRVRPPR